MDIRNVGLFCDAFPPVMDGVSVCMENYARLMQEKVGGVAVVTPHVPGADYKSLPYKVLDYFSIPVPMRHPYVTGIAEIDPFFLADIARTRFRIVHAHCPFATGLAAQRIAKIQGIPLVATFHSKYREDFLRVFPKRITDQIVKGIVNFYESADMVWVPQASVCDVIREYGYRGEVEVMDNGSYLVADYSDSFFADCRKELGLGPDELALLFVGQHIWEKNPRLVIESLAELEDIPFRMFFVGGGYASEAMKALVRDCGIEDKVTFVGPVRDRNEIRKYYAAADLFLFPSLYDNAPLVVREAAALHTPSVMARGATASSVIDDGVNGFLTANDAGEMASLLRSLSGDRERIRRAGLQASRTIVRSWESCVDEVLVRYNDLLSSRGLPPVSRIKQ